MTKEDYTIIILVLTVLICIGRNIYLSLKITNLKWEKYIVKEKKENPELNEIRGKCQEAIDYIEILDDDPFDTGQITAYQNVIDCIDEIERDELTKS